VVDTKAASNTSRFDAEAFARVTDEEPGSEFATSRVTQVSDVQGGVSASGTFDFQVSGQFARGRSQLVAVYEVSGSSYDYNLNYLLGPVTSDLGVSGVAFKANIQLTRLNGRGGESPEFEPIDIDLADRSDDGVPNQAADTLTGRLVPGRYRFTFDMQGLSIDFNHSYGANYRVDLGFQQVAPTPVPLPSAGWAGLFGLGGVAALGVIRRRRPVA
jgi:MYXO-CTERM domain-containing protein